MSALTQRTIAIEVKVVDELGQPAAVQHLCGRVLNEWGEHVDTIDINMLTEDPLGTYSLAEYSIEDFTKFPGNSLTIIWTTNNACPPHHSALTPKQTYRFVGMHQLPYKHRLITWAPSYKKNLYGYELLITKMNQEAMIAYDAHNAALAEYRANIAAGIFVDEFDQPLVEPVLPDGIPNLLEPQRQLAVTTDAWLLDPTDYEDAAVAEGSAIFVKELLWTPTRNGIQGGAKMKNIHTQPLLHDVCIIRGDLRVINGMPSELNRVTFYIDSLDGAAAVDNSIVLTDRAMSAIVHPSGFFSIPLIQGLAVIVDIPETSYRRKFIVPSQESANLIDIPSEPVSFRYRY